MGPNAAPDPAAAQPWGTAPPARGWALGNTTLKFIVYRDANYNTQSFPLAANGVIDDAALRRYRAATKDGDADDPAALDNFIRTNRKLIIYHGFGDHALSPMETISFYERLAARDGRELRNAGAQRAPVHGAGDAALRSSSRGSIPSTR